LGKIKPCVHDAVVTLLQLRHGKQIVREKRSKDEKEAEGPKEEDEEEEEEKVDVRLSKPLGL
jgi:hypothetical protein